MKKNFGIMSVDQLKEKYGELKKEMFNFSFQRATGQLQNISRIRQVRRDVARVLTFLKQKAK